MSVWSEANLVGEAELGAALSRSLAAWRAEGVRGCWLHIHIQDAAWVPICAKVKHSPAKSA